jgi:RNA polymerase sigma factor (sigma-70 family)
VYNGGLDPMALGRRQTHTTTGPLPALRRAVDDASAFDELYDELAERVLVFFTRRVLDGQLALDLTGETFAIAFQQRRRFRGTTTEEQEGWIFAIARSQLARYWRRGRVEREALERLGVEVPVMGDAELERVDELAASAQVRAHLARELGRLPADQRHALQAHVVEERPYAELSREWGVSEQTLRARVSRGLRALSATLDAPVTEHVP